MSRFSLYAIRYLGELYLGHNAFLSVCFDEEISKTMPIATLITTNTALGRHIPYRKILFPLFFKKNKFIATSCDIIGFLMV